MLMCISSRLMILMILVCISSRLYDDMIMSRRDYMRLMLVLVCSRRDYMRLMCILVEILCETVKFYGGPLDFFAFLCYNVGLTHKNQTPSYKTSRTLYKTFYYSYTHKDFMRIEA